MYAANSTRRRTTTVDVIVAAIIGLVAAAACTSTSGGTPTPVETPSGDESGTDPTSEPETQRSLRDLAMCDIFLPADVPVRPDQGGSVEHDLEDDGEACAVTIQQSDVFDIITAKVVRREGDFSTYSPPPRSANGRFTEISGRRAWVGDPSSSPSDEQCFAAFGAADGHLGLGLVDETQRGVDPCETAVQIAEKVISRTPAPYTR